MHESKPRLVGYWLTTGLLSLAFLVAGTMYLAGAQVVREGISELGYPGYVVTLLGACKVLGGFALLAPGLPRLKEWAYAGIAFNLIGAAFSHAAAGHPRAIIPLVYLGIAIASWSLRPASRRLDTRPKDPEARPSDLRGGPASMAPSGA